MQPCDPAAPPLWRATVPVFLGVLDRLEASLRRAETKLGDGYATGLARRPQEHMLPAARQVATAVQFTLRIAYPLAGQRVPEVRAPLDAGGLMERIEATRALLRALDPGAFADAGTRVVRDQAGFAVLDLPGEAYLNEFGLPNLYFHHAMAHVALKQAGVPLGKADFDGKHDYPEGFSLG
ncbi:hypothetical protein HNP73_003221 [Amaricoccus macauensis]|uniref:DUF1993 domain-containing protein n=1 Tax=Amaricoccus macauensis TaxID=57001 RepID=A0A840SQB7_9RHOB|nr:DUF1993 family protein [Amaricoccus macauensis]MBB5223274.1 hypothetical protein [Amaricoccus macauensis]